MRHLSLAAALLVGSAITTPALADGHLRIVDEPLELPGGVNNKQTEERTFSPQRFRGF